MAAGVLPTFWEPDRRTCNPDGTTSECAPWSTEATAAGPNPGRHRAYLAIGCRQGDVAAEADGRGRRPAPVQWYRPRATQPERAAGKRPGRLRINWNQEESGWILSRKTRGRFGFYYCARPKSKMRGGVSPKSTLPHAPPKPIFPAMRTARQTPPKPRQLIPEVGVMYRGIRLHPYDGPGPSRFTREQVKEAIKAAFLKHADAIASETKP